VWSLGSPSPFNRAGEATHVSARGVGYLLSLEHASALLSVLCSEEHNYTINKMYAQIDGQPLSIQTTQNHDKISLTNFNKMVWKN
jgi:hypothetical protein